MGTYHSLKTWPDYWWAVDSGEKNFEVRRDDRGFQKGDILLLHCWDPNKEKYMSNSSDFAQDVSDAMTAEREVTWILTGGQFGLEPGYVVLGLRPHAT
ncbi:MAG: ASCH/PUA domain-containing protein [Cognatishimia activa]